MGFVEFGYLEASCYIKIQLQSEFPLVPKTRAYYIRTKHWHSFQSEIQETADFIDFEWHVYTYRELTSKIFELGHDAEIISPVLPQIPN